MPRGLKRSASKMRTVLQNKLLERAAPGPKATLGYVPAGMCSRKKVVQSPLSLLKEKF